MVGGKAKRMYVGPFFSVLCGAGLLVLCYVGPYPLT